MRMRGLIFTQTVMRNVEKSIEPGPDSELLHSASERLKVGLTEGVLLHFVHRYPGLGSVRSTLLHLLRRTKMQEEEWCVRQHLR